MSHSERCLSANRFGDGFDCICDLAAPGYRAGYEAGLRRAQELAEQRARTTWLFRDAVIQFVGGLNEALDAEVSKR